jgi:hypothetical protein
MMMMMITTYFDILIGGKRGDGHRGRTSRGDGNNGCGVYHANTFHSNPSSAKGYHCIPHSIVHKRRRWYLVTKHEKEESSDRKILCLYCATINVVPVSSIAYPDDP